MPVIETKTFEPEVIDHLMAMEHMNGHLVPFPFRAHRLPNGIGLPITPIERVMRNIQLEDALREKPLKQDEIMEMAIDRTLAATRGAKLVEFAERVKTEQQQRTDHVQATAYGLEPYRNGVIATIHSFDSGISVSALLPDISQYPMATLSAEVLGDTYYPVGDGKDYPITALSIIRTCIVANSTTR